MNKQTNDKKAAGMNEPEWINKNANFEPDGLMT